MTTETTIIKTSTPKTPSRHREFFEKLYGSLETTKKIDSSSSSDESTSDPKKDNSDSSGQSNHEEKTSPLRPFPSFPAGIDQSRFLPVSSPSAQQTFPYFSHQFGHHGSPASAGNAASMEAALRLPDFPFPGGLAAFCKYFS